jgi:hypothetical protein
MGIRINRRIKIAKGLSLSVSKSGVSASAKVGRVTVNSRRGVTANVAKGVSVNVPVGKSAPRGKVAKSAQRAVAAVPAAPAGPRTFRRPFGRVPGWLYWTLGIIVAVLVGAIPYAGPLLLIAVVCALVAVWLMTPKQIEGQAVEAAPVAAEAVESVDIPEAD